MELHLVKVTVKQNSQPPSPATPQLGFHDILGLPMGVAGLGCTSTRRQAPVGFDCSLPRAVSSQEPVSSTNDPSSRLPPLSLPGIQPAVFAFPCATLITMMLAFIMYMTLRNAAHHKDLVEVGTRWAGGWAPGP